LNGDAAIDFEEFFELFIYLNDQLEIFLLMDSDGNGLIDSNEFEKGLNKAGYKFSKQFFQFIANEIKHRTGKQGITFDNYIRIQARFDYLSKSYKDTPYYQNHPLESYLKNTIFYNF
jgi:hypothetical protein